VHVLMLLSRYDRITEKGMEAQQPRRDSNVRKLGWGGRLEPGHLVA
jgi:hypothetical protein